MEEKRAMTAAKAPTRSRRALQWTAGSSHEGVSWQQQ